MNTQGEDKDLEIEVEIDGADDAQDVEGIKGVEDTGDKAKTPHDQEAAAKPDAPDGMEDDSDLSDVSERVKKRINKLRWEFHEQKRAREAAEHEAAAAKAYAESLKTEAERVRKTLETGETVLVSQAKARVDSQLVQVRAEFRQAYESGDAEALANAQQKMVKLQVEKDRLDNFRPRPQAPLPQAPQPRETQQAPDPKAAAWVARNAWFTEDPAMRGFALGVHGQLVAEGVDLSSDTYYARIDAAVKQRFPEKFDVAAKEDKVQPRRPATVVATSERNTGQSPRKVTLSPAQVATARRLGVPLEAYAKQLLEIERRDR